MFTALRTAIRPTARLVQSQVSVSVAAKPMSLSRQAIRFASTTRFSTDHEWVSYDPDTSIGIVGITDYAQKALGDVVFVELPTEGTEVAQGDSIGAVESVKAASDIYAPVSGVIESINETLAESPSLLNKKPQSDGWLCKIKLSGPQEFETLLNEEAYKAHCEGEA